MHLASLTTFLTKHHQENEGDQPSPTGGRVRAASLSSSHPPSPFAAGKKSFEKNEKSLFKDARDELLSGIQSVLSASTKVQVLSGARQRSSSRKKGDEAKSVEELERENLFLRAELEGALARLQLVASIAGTSPEKSGKELVEELLERWRAGQ